MAKDEKSLRNTSAKLSDILETQGNGYREIIELIPLRT